MGNFSPTNLFGVEAPPAASDSKDHRGVTLIAVKAPLGVAAPVVMDSKDGRGETVITEKYPVGVAAPVASDSKDGRGVACIAEVGVVAAPVVLDSKDGRGVACIAAGALFGGVLTATFNSDDFRGVTPT